MCIWRRLQDALQSDVRQVTQHLVFTEGAICAMCMYFNVIDEILDTYNELKFIKTKFLNKKSVETQMFIGMMAHTHIWAKRNDLIKRIVKKSDLEVWWPTPKLKLRQTTKVEDQARWVKFQMIICWCCCEALAKGISYN